MHIHREATYSANHDRVLFCLWLHTAETKLLNEFTFQMKHHGGHLELNGSLVVLAKCEESASLWANIAQRLISSLNDFVKQPFEIITIIPISFKVLLTMCPLFHKILLKLQRGLIFINVYSGKWINKFFVNSIFVSILPDYSISKRLNLTVIQCLRTWNIVQKKKKSAEPLKYTSFPYFFSGEGGKK